MSSSSTVSSQLEDFNNFEYTLTDKIFNICCSLSTTIILALQSSAMYLQASAVLCVYNPTGIPLLESERGNRFII